MYSFNLTLFSLLPALLGIKKCDFCRSVGHHHGWHTRIAKEYHDVALVDLLRICNLYQLPIAYFFTREGDERQIVTPAANYTAASLTDGSILRDLALGQKGEAGVCELKVKALFGIRLANGKQAEWMKNPSELTAMQLVRACNLLKLNMTQFINDPMHLLPTLFTAAEHAAVVRTLLPDASGVKPKSKRKAAATKMQRLTAKNRQLERELEELRAQMAELKKDAFDGISLAADPAKSLYSAKKK